MRSFLVYNPVYVQYFGNGSSQIPATVIEPTEPVTYKAKTPSGNIIHCYIYKMLCRLSYEVERFSSKYDDIQNPNASPIPRSEGANRNFSSKNNDSNFITTPAGRRQQINHPKHFKDFIMT